MAVLEVLTYPDERLRQTAEKVEVIGEKINHLINDMQSTMYLNQGIGLAATQLGVNKRVLIIDLSAGKEPGNFMAFINPEIITAGKETETDEEGCLSVPGIRERVKRHKDLVLRAFDREGQGLKIKADGLLARAIQHELDHLKGKLFIDRLPLLKRMMLRARLRSPAKRDK